MNEQKLERLAFNLAMTVVKLHTVEMILQDSKHINQEKLVEDLKDMLDRLNQCCKDILNIKE